VDNGFGEVVAATAVREVFVSEHGSADGDGSAARPLASVGAAAALLGDANGIVHIVGTVPYSAPPPHRGIITYRGEGKSTRLVFDRPYYYYVSGDSVFDNLYLVMYSEGTALVSAGHSLRYGPSVWTTVNMFSVLSQPSPESETALAFGDPLLLSSEQSTTISAPHNYVLLYCFSDHALLQVGKSSHTLSAGGAVFLHDPDNVSVRCGTHARIFVCTFRSFPSSLQNVRIKPVRAAAATLFGNILEQVWADPSLFQTDAIRKALSDAVHTVMGIDDSRMKIHHQLNLFLESHFAEISSVEEVARQFHMNRSYLEREFKKTYGFGIKQDLTRRKLEAARKLLSKGFSVAQAAKSVGYDNAATFSRAFRKFMGLPPSAYYRKQ
jgi:AraC-like DNA-binding protein